MGSQSKTKLRERVEKAAAITLKREGSIGPLELLQQMYLLETAHFQRWQQRAEGFEILEDHIQCGAKKLDDIYQMFEAWIKTENLESIPATYVAVGRNGQEELQITKDHSPARERYFRTRYRSANLSEARKKSIEKKANKVPDLVVNILTSDPTDCDDCGGVIDRGEMLFLEQSKPICLECADLAHLEFLPSGNVAMTRRSKKYSPLSAVVLEFNRRRKRYDRRGLLVARKAIDQAEEECDADADVRAARREQQAQRVAQQDQKLVADMAALIVDRYPGCPPAEAREISEHTAVRGSGRVGRSAAGRSLDSDAITLAVRAWIRHQHTEYDRLLMSGVERMTAREQIESTIREVLRRWSSAI